MPILTMAIASENTSRVLDGIQTGLTSRVLDGIQTGLSSRVLDGIQTGLTSRVLDVIPLFRPGSVSSGSPS